MMCSAPSESPMIITSEFFDGFDLAVVAEREGAEVNRHARVRSQCLVRFDGLLGRDMHGTNQRGRKAPMGSSARRSRLNLSRISAKCGPAAVSPAK